MSLAQKNVQLNGVFLKNKNKISPQKDQEASMDLENPQKYDINIQNESQTSILTAMGSME